MDYTHYRSGSVSYTLSSHGGTEKRFYIPERVLDYFNEEFDYREVANSNRKSICIALFLNKLYLYHDVSPLNKVFTALHRSTLVCILGTISEYKGNISF